MTQQPRYHTPRAVSTALGQRAKTTSRTGKSTHSPEELTRQYHFHRFLARVAAHDQAGWVLKGGQALLVRYRHGRASRDIDLYNRQARTLDQAVDALKAAAAVDLGDYFQFRFIDRKDRNGDQAEPAESTKLRFEPWLGADAHTIFGVDVVVGLLPTQTPEVQAIMPEIQIDWPMADEPPQLMIYPLVDHLADKICALYETHNDGPSSRYRDLVDILLIATAEDVSAEDAIRAVISESARRQHSGRVNLTLPARFEVPGPAWSAGFETEAQNAPTLGELRDFPAACQLADAFLSPILASTRTGHWRHSTRSWH